MKPGISAIIVVSNQQELLRKCLDSIHKWADEIILIDLSSTEDIKSIAKIYKAKYILESKKISIVETVRQSSISYASHEYVLFLDPDETIPKSLSVELLAKIKTGIFDYFVTPRQNIVFGKWVRHSRWWPDYQIRLFRQGKVTWGTTLHAPPKESGKSFKFLPVGENAIVHENYRNLDEFISKNMRYAKTDALERFKSGEKFNLSIATRLSISELISRFFQGEGYKDGMHGLVLAILQSFYYFMVYSYYWEYKEYQELESSPSIKSFPRKWFAHGLSETLYWDKAKSFTKTIKEKFVRRMIA